jgi:hypothetical protein
MQVQLTWLSPNPENKLINLLNTTNATRGAETDPLPEQLRHPWFVVYREQSLVFYVVFCILLCFLFPLAIVLPVHLVFD